MSQDFLQQHFRQCVNNPGMICWGRWKGIWQQDMKEWISIFISAERHNEPELWNFSQLEKARANQRFKRVRAWSVVTPGFLMDDFTDKQREPRPSSILGTTLGGAEITLHYISYKKLELCCPLSAASFINDTSLITMVPWKASRSQESRTELV